MPRSGLDWCFKAGFVEYFLSIRLCTGDLWSRSGFIIRDNESFRTR